MHYDLNEYPSKYQRCVVGLKNPPTITTLTSSIDPEI